MVLEGERQAAAWPAPSSLAAFAELPVGAAEAALAVASPIQWRGASPGCPPRVSDLVRLAVDRARSVARAVGVRVDRWWPSPDAVAGEWSDPVWVAGSRWSQRQGARVDLSGWTGTLRLDPTGVEDLLAAAVVLGVGRGTSAGMGRLRWV